MGRTRLALVLATVLLATMALAFAGCGGSSTKPLTRAELIMKANAICKVVSAKFASKTINNQNEIATVLPELVGFEQNELAELSKLVPPAALANDWKEFVSGAETLAENTSKLSEYTKAKDLKGASGLFTASETTQAHMRVIAKRDGILDCEQVP